jgi:galactose mutarotase-like enzyme
MSKPTATAEEFRKTSSMPTRVLESALIRVEVAPALGGKLVSLRSKGTGTEWLLPPLKAYEEASTQGGFEGWDGGGFDECLPTVAATETAPDHGEVWRHAWQEEPSENSVLLRTTALDGAVVLERRAHLDGSTLVLDYSVDNGSHAPQSLLYCAHPLFQVEQSDHILLSPDVRSVTIEGSAAYRLGQRGDQIPWPNPKTGIDLSVVGPPDGMQADKLFAGPLASGWCALLRPSLDEGIELTFTTDTLPYLGLWICRAAWPESGAAKQYTVAFEPASAPSDSLADAQRQGTAWTLAPGERRTWTLRFRLGTRREIEGWRNLEEAR